MSAGVRRLDSWKEIAAHFGRDVRTVRRWEAERGLPVHRVPGKERGGVFAYSDELERWLRDPDAPGPVGLPEPEESVAPALLGPAADDLTGEETEAPSMEASEIARLTPERLPVVGRYLLLLLIGLVGGLIAAVLVRGHATSAKAATPALPGDAATRDLYLRGRYLLEQRTNTSLTEAAGLFTKVIAREPQSAEAYAGLAETYLLLRQYGTMSDADAYQRAYAASRRAVKLDGGSMEAHRAFGFVLNFWMWNFVAAEAEFQRAIELDSRDAQTRQWYASSLFSVGRDQDALAQIELARQLQPDSVAILAMRGFFLRTVDPAAAKSALEEIVRTQPEFGYAHRYLALVYLGSHQDAEFLKQFQTYFEMEKRQAEARVVERAKGALERSGPEAMFEALAAGFGGLAEAPGSSDAMDAAEFYAHLRKPEQTLHFLSLSCERHESNFQIVPALPAYAFLKGNLEFEALVERGRTPLQEPEAASGGISAVASR